MSKKVGLGIIGFGHMHINNVAALYADHPAVEWVACADTVPTRPELRAAPYTREWNRAHLQEKLDIPRSYEDYHEMLEQEQFDIVIVTCENAQHADVVEACAGAGAHVCVEKPMAPSLPDALRMARACGAAGTTLLVNWPLTWSPGARTAKALIDQGVIGRVLEVKWRAGHTGPLGSGARHAGVSRSADAMTGPERGATWWHQAAAGGGAALCFSSYGAMGSMGDIGERANPAPGLKADLDSPRGDHHDNGAIPARLPSATAPPGGPWTTWDHGVPTGPIVFGTEGTLVVESRDGAPVVRLERGGGDTTFYEAQPLPEGQEDVAQEFIHHLETGERLHPTLEVGFNLDAMAILDAGVRSATSGRLEVVNSTAWCIG
ncbi:MAG: Gfo/Idh/MocA family oxidoreductase [Chloroflexi bacterium]|nr:Gfo/Idh/MocA family oxidoreductase [Chloroflexota bacterium]